MNKITIYKASLIISTGFNLLGSFFKIAHYPYGNSLLLIGFLASLVFIILGVTDVLRTESGKPMEKLMWTVGFLFLSWLSGILYYPKYKKRNS
jgi:hypothetical protein